MKEFKIIFAAALLALTASCAGSGDFYPDRPARIRLSFAEPLASTRAAAYDTNSFILSIISSGGDTIYYGSFGQRPRQLQVRAGTYEIEAVSLAEDAPAFDCPRYGDRQIVVVSNGQQADVSLLCRRVNAGIRLSFTSAFRHRYPCGALHLASGEWDLEYGYDETRTAYFSPGDVSFIYRESDAREETLFVRNVASGEVHNLTLNASSDSSLASFAICVDDRADTLDQTLLVGDRYSGADGLSMESAFDVKSAAGRMGDTVWVWGYVVGGDLTASGISFAGPFEKSSHLALSDSPSEGRRENCFPVELSRKAVKDALNLVDNPHLLGKKVFLRGVVSTYFSLAGLKSVTDYVLQ